MDIKKILHENGNKQTKKAGVAMLIPDKTDFKRKSIATDKKWL